jgi:PAS domain S-box-containing protein
VEVLPIGEGIISSSPESVDSLQERIRELEATIEHMEDGLAGERYRELFENANDVIFLQDLQGKILTINRAAETVTGYSRQEVLGHSIDQLIAPEARYLHHDSIRAHLGGSATQHYELAFLSKDHKRRFLDVSSRILYRSGQPHAVQGIGRDVTERKLAQQRLEQSAKALEQSNKELITALRLAREATQLKEQFLANTSHELRTPLNGIMGMINLLKTTELTEDQRDYAETVGQCANDLLVIINDLLDLSQMEAGRLTLDEELIELQVCLEAVLKLQRVRAEGKGLTLALEIDAVVPSQVFADGIRLRQVMTNLVGNAVKFTTDGGVRVKVSLTTCGRHFRCEVIDSGIGVSEAVHERIFQAFVQADGTTHRKFGGNGLGLTICKQLIEIMGGRIGLHRNADGSSGTTFWFELPVRTSKEMSVLTEGPKAIA